MSRDELIRWLDQHPEHVCVTNAVPLCCTVKITRKFFVNDNLSRWPDVPVELGEAVRAVVVMMIIGRSRWRHQPTPLALKMSTLKKRKSSFNCVTISTSRVSLKTLFLTVSGFHGLKKKSAKSICNLKEFQTGFDDVTEPRPAGWNVLRAS